MNIMAESKCQIYLSSIALQNFPLSPHPSLQQPTKTNKMETKARLTIV